jgi:D-tyrosyl-tRNA(Tyr) deacylase
MRVLLQRVSSAAVDVDGERIAHISLGLLVFVGLHPDDGAAEIDWMADKVLGLRIFPDADKPMNASVADVGGQVLIVSQFTLAADTSRGKRPGFSTAAPPEQAANLYQRFVDAVAERYSRVCTGAFGADMQVSLVNDGPVTFLLERHAAVEGRGA